RRDAFPGGSVRRRPVDGRGRCRLRRRRDPGEGRIVGRLRHAAGVHSAPVREGAAGSPGGGARAGFGPAPREAPRTRWLTPGGPQESAGVAARSGMARTVRVASGTATGFGTMMGWKE